MAEAMQLPPPSVKEQKNWLDYNYRLAKKIDIDFVRGVGDIRDILMLLHEVDESLFSDREIAELSHHAEKMNRMDAASKLLDTLKRHKDFFPALLQVLRNPVIRMEHLAELLQKCKEELDVDLMRETRPRTEDSAWGMPDLLQAPTSEFNLSSNQDDCENGDVLDQGMQKRTYEYESPVEKEGMETDVAQVTDKSLAELYQQIGLSPKGMVYEPNEIGGYCYVCKVSCSSAIVEKDHLAGKRHLKNAAKAEEDLQKKKITVVGVNSPTSSLMKNIDSSNGESGSKAIVEVLEALHIQTPEKTGGERITGKSREEDANRDGLFGKGIASCKEEPVHSSLETGLEDKLDMYKPFTVEEGKEYENDFVSLHKNGTGECRLCRVVFTSFSPAKQHLEGKPHAKELTKHGSGASVSNLLPPTLGPNGQPWQIDAGKGCCFLCSKNLESSDKSETHFNGRIHKKKLADYKVWKERNP